MISTLPDSPVTLGIDTNRVLLNRYRFVLQESLRLLAGWLPKTATFELKCELGRTIWENSQHVRFGKRWLPELLTHTGETRSADEYTAAVLDIWKAEYLTGKLSLNVE